MASQSPSGGERTLGALAYWGPLVFVPLLLRRKARFVAYHTRQGLYLFAVAVAAFLVTLGLLYVFQRPVPVEAVFLILSVVLLLETVAYGVVVLFLSVGAARGKMPMLPLIGDLAGEGKGAA